MLTFLEIQRIASMYLIEEAIMAYLHEGWGGLTVQS